MLEAPKNKAELAARTSVFTDPDIAGAMQLFAKRAGGDYSPETAILTMKAVDLFDKRYGEYEKQLSEAPTEALRKDLQELAPMRSVLLEVKAMMRQELEVRAAQSEEVLSKEALEKRYSNMTLKKSDKGGTKVNVIKRGGNSKNPYSKDSFKLYLEENKVGRDEQERLAPVFFPFAATTAVIGMFFGWLWVFVLLIPVLAVVYGAFYAYEYCFKFNDLEKKFNKEEIAFSFFADNFSAIEKNAFGTQSSRWDVVNFWEKFIEGLDESLRPQAFAYLEEISELGHYADEKDVAEHYGPLFRELKEANEYINDVKEVTNLTVGSAEAAYTMFRLKRGKEIS